MPCVDGTDRPYLPLDAAGATGALPQVLDAVQTFLPWYSSADHGAGYKTQASVLAYQSARLAALAFAGRGPDSGDVAVIRQNATEAIHHLACQLKLGSGDVVVTTVAEHHANLLPWSRTASCRYVECGQDGTFEPGDVAAALDQRPVPRLLAITGVSHVTGWLPPLGEIIAAAHHRGIPVLVDAAQLAPHRPLPAKADFLAWSGYKMYAPFGSGVLVGPRPHPSATDRHTVPGNPTGPQGTRWPAARDRCIRPGRQDPCQPGGYPARRTRVPVPVTMQHPGLVLDGGTGGLAPRSQHPARLRRRAGSSANALWPRPSVAGPGDGCRLRACVGGSGPAGAPADDPGPHTASCAVQIADVTASNRCRWRRSPAVSPSRAAVTASSATRTSRSSRTRRNVPAPG